MNAIRVRLYGGFAQYFEDEEIEIQVNGAMTVQDFRKHVYSVLKNKNRAFDGQLLDDSVFATETFVLRESDTININQKIAILPPVCGG